MNASKRGIAVVVMAAAGTILPTASPVSVAAPNRAGDPDPTFGGDGKVTTNFRSGEELRVVAIDADGKIMVAGCTGGHGGPIALARYNANGTLDTSFGGDGKVTTDLAHRGGDCALDVAIQDDGKIVAAGHSGFGVHGKFAVLRYNPEGRLDTTFGGDGRVATDFTPDSDFAAAVAIQADGKIIAAGQSGVFGANTMFALARYNPDGTRDTTFGEHGRVITDFTPGDDGANDVALQADGKIVVVGGAGTDRPTGSGTGFALARYEADGTLDFTFGGDGQVTTATTVGKGDAASAVEILSNSKILAAGVDGTGGCRPCGSDMSTSFALVQYNADGTIDTGFGGSGEGLVITPLSPKDDAASDLAIQSDGKIVVAGVSGQRSRGGGDSRFALVRYEADGTRDQTFGGDGKVTTNFSPGWDFASGMAIQPDGKIVAAGIADYLGTHDRFALARYFSDAASQPGSDLTQVRFPPETTTQRLEGATDTSRRAGQSLPPTGRASPGNGRIVFQRVFWAPDGSAVKIAMFTVKPDGTGIRQLTHPPRGVETGRADWSPDGRWITYMRTGLAEPRRPRIFVMRRNGADRTDLTKGHCRPSSCQGENDPAWSAHGKRIAFVRSAGDTPSIFVMSAAGRQRRQVTTPPRARFIDSAPAWSPDGKRLVFMRLDQKREAAALFIVRLDSANVRRITPWSLDDLNHPDWSSDGRWIVFQKPSRSGETHLYLIHPNGAGLRKVTQTPHFAWSWAGFSPDGRMITAVRVPGEESENDVYVMKLDGTGVQSVTGSLSRRQAEGLPDWGPLRLTRRSDARLSDPGRPCSSRSS